MAFLPIAASVKTGWCSATYVLDRFGAASQGYGTIKLVALLGGARPDNRAR
jgi:hypothetical protein